MDRGYVKNLSSRQREQKFGSMDRKSYQDSTEKKPKNLDGLRSCRDAIEKAENTGILLDGARICQGFY